jgi:hypothetical protein
VDSIFSEGGQDGTGSMLGNTRPINLIPSRKKGACCCPLLLAFAQGRNKRSAFGFASTLRQVKTHLIDCSAVTKAVIVVTDTWDSDEFLTEHFAELGAHYRKGIRFLFLLAGEAPVALSPIGIDFRKAA